MIRSVLFIALTILLLIPLFIDKSIIREEQYDGKENFNQELQDLTSLSSLEQYIDSTAHSNGIQINSPGYAIHTEKIIADRFYHGFSHLTLSDNWIANFAQKITGMGLACKVQPYQIIEESNAACSQQALVMMEILKRKNTNYRHLEFPHHYALEANYGNNWYYMDPDMEPQISAEKRSHSYWQGNNDSLKYHYASRNYELLENRFGSNLKAGIGEPNSNPAPRLKLFQHITGFISGTAWLIPLALLVFYRSRKRKASIK